MLPAGIPSWADSSWQPTPVEVSKGKWEEAGKWEKAGRKPDLGEGKKVGGEMGGGEVEYSCKAL